MSTSVNEKLVAEIEKNLGHHRKWRRNMSVAYFVVSGATILSAGTATVVAGLGLSGPATVAAGAATVFAGLEKGLLLQQKWSHHLALSTQLEALLNDYKFGETDTARATKRLNELIRDNALRLPVTAHRD